MIIALSGPQHGYQKAQDTLAKAGFRVVVNDQDSPVPDDYGLGQDDPTVPACFLTVEGESPDAAHEAVVKLGWRLRAHWDKQEPPKKEPLAQTLARLGIDPAELRSLLGA